ncbi:MAG TPA: HAD hydrolase-like protein [Candidatus Nanoarchaeia archaeon]|nr:HAD hydrolase-like protein [Candidatus Nanoarchaeia archaeon]
MKPHIFYDYDGTLGDTLLEHIQFLHDMNQKYDTQLNLPSTKDYKACKKLISMPGKPKTTGVPMEILVRNAGFPENLIQRVLMMYKKTFDSNPNYQGKLFQGVPELIQNMFNAGFHQSILPSNVRKNFMPPLERADIKHLFANSLDLNELKKYHSLSKVDCLRDYSDRFCLSSQECIYVGDTDGDFLAAQKVEVVFVGVSYGWQTQQGKKYPFPVAHNCSQLQRILLSLGELKDDDNDNYKS